MIKKLRLLFFVLFAQLIAACATVGTEKSILEDASFDEFVAEEMINFQSDREFKNFVRDVRRKSKRRGVWWANNTSTQLAQQCLPDDEECDEVIVTASKSKSSSSSSSITNTQNIGVDEGDIVKHYKQFLIVLQDGRLFSVDTGHHNSDLALIDRMNVYRDDSFDAWYDELLIFENMLLVTGYSYQAEATELAVFKISENGDFSHQGTFYKSSDDYYDTDNYATRLVDGNLVLYTPIDLTTMDLRGQIRWPVIRKWKKSSEKGKPYSNGRSLFNARDIFYPIQRTGAPVLHTISICPLTNTTTSKELACKTKAVIGPANSEYYVSKNSAFLWASPGWDDTETDEDLPICPYDIPTEFQSALPSALFSFPLSGQPPKGLIVNGKPIDQFSLESSPSEFKAILEWTNPNCENDSDTRHLKFLKFSLNNFSTDIRKVKVQNYSTVPPVKGFGFENRFTDEYLVYSARQRYRSYATEKKGRSQSSITVVSTADPKQTAQLFVDHEIIRAERAGDNIVVTGHENNTGLYVSMVGLDKSPIITDTLLIKDRYESEGRSHAFNSDIKPDSSGLLGIPTSLRVKESGRYWWRSIGSDVSFMSVDSNGKITNIGPIKGDEDSIHPDYECEMSCIDWYGNTRPIFIDGRVFALIGTELVEAKVMGTQIIELKRLNISDPLKQKVEPRRIASILSLN